MKSNQCIYPIKILSLIASLFSWYIWCYILFGYFFFFLFKKKEILILVFGICVLLNTQNFNNVILMWSLMFLIQNHIWVFFIFSNVSNSQQQFHIQTDMCYKLNLTIALMASNQMIIIFFQTIKINVKQEKPKCNDCIKFSFFQITILRMNQWMILILWCNFCYDKDVKEVVFHSTASHIHNNISLWLCTITYHISP